MSSRKRWLLVVSLLILIQNLTSKSFAREMASENSAALQASRFSNAVAYFTAGTFVSSIAVADLNGDGNPDLVAANYCTTGSNCEFSGSIAVLLGNGDGTFQPAVVYDSGGIGPAAVVIADVNGDGKPDLLVANFKQVYDNGAAVVDVLLGNGDGTFQTAISYMAGGYFATSLFVADVNGDGKLDLVVSNDLCCNGNGPESSVGILFGNGDGTFQPVVTYDSGGYGAESVTVADVNGDGLPDVVVANQCIFNDCGSGSSEGSLGVLLNNGDGTFQPAMVYGSGGVGAWSVVATDVNQDRTPDLLVSNHCADIYCDTSGTVGVLLGNGDGTFQDVVTYPSGGLSNSIGYPFGSPSIAVADVNSDGKPDLIVANECADDGNCNYGDNYGLLSILLGNGDGTFQPAITYKSGGFHALSATAADVNHDRRPDLLVANYCSLFQYCGDPDGTVGVLLNNIAPVTLASSANPIQLNQGVTFTAAVQAANGTTPTGTVTFYNGDVVNGVVQLDGSGQAKFDRAFYTPGTKSITAAYSGDTHYPPNNSPVLLEGVGGYPTSTVITSHANPSAIGQIVSFKATVSPSIAAVLGASSGTVTFESAGSGIGTVPLSDGQASLNFVFGEAGTKPITAIFSGDANFASSESPVLREVIGSGRGIATTTVVTSNPNPSNVGQVVALVAYVSSSQGSPTGTVTFKLNGNQIIGQAAVSNGQASMNYIFGRSGTDLVTAIYSGNSTFAPSVGTLTQIVQ